MNTASSGLTIIYDNNTLEKGLVPGWGFSCLINLPELQILFDTGGDSSILLNNMHNMGIDPERIDSVILSHAHGDHVGGLSGLLRENHPIKVFIPESFPRGFKEDVGLLGGAVQNAGGSVMVHPGVYTTGELGRSIREQSLILETFEGLVIITGCAHPGLVEIVEHTRGLFNEKVYLLIGGFHLMGQSDEEIKNILSRLGQLNVERVAPCHCTGDRARELFSLHYGENYFECGAGLSLEMPGLIE
jgi:7,8-dihydropterin-6-yl-methyl-4-(beta-D-ribofuranosyl)aminobenzene 5'-phosphate synthase